MGAGIFGDEISATINSLLDGKRSIKLLEAGCGSASYFNFTAAVNSVGIDVSREQLDRNKVIQQKILGDLQSYPLPEEEFDVVVCWDVIEHLSKPKDALLNMFNTTKVGGFVILGFPNLGSIKGAVTKATPFWFHRVFYSYMKYKSRPFKTYLRFAILPNKVIRFAGQHGFSVAYLRLVDGGVTKRIGERFWVAKALFSVLDFGARVVTFGKCRSLYLENCGLILRKEKPTL